MLVHCTQCGSPTDRTPWAVKHRKHIFCSEECFHKFQREKAAKCPACGKFPGKGRYYCSETCANVSYVLKWKAGKTTFKSEYVPVFIRRYLREKYGNKCSRCGWSVVNKTTGNVPLTVEHMDGNPENHAESNLDLICPNCHSLTETYGALNKGKGRKLRQLRRKQHYHSGSEPGCQPD